MALAGDSLITRDMTVFDDPDFVGLLAILREADVSITNAEMLFHEYENPPTYVPGGSYMQAAPHVIDELAAMGFNMVALANNHAYDYGEGGLVTHLRHLGARRLPHAGLGLTLGEAREPAYLDTRAGRVALIAATSSGPPGLYAQHQWRDGKGRPGANMIRYTSRFTVDSAAFEALRRMRDQLGLRGLPGPAHSNHSLGMSQIRDSDTEFYMSDLHNRFQYPTPNGYHFVAGEEFSCKLIPDEADLQENLQRIQDARRMADWVVVSFHNHEGGATAADPSNVATTFAHAAIDAGADVFHGHGPHMDRGIEIYQGKPIFYSLGDFILQNDTVRRVPLDNMRRVGIDSWEATPADFYDARSGREHEGERTGMFARSAAWQSVIAIVEFQNGGLERVRLQPIDLGFHRSRAQRGRPVIARGTVALDVLHSYQQLCEPFGTAVEIDGQTGLVQLPG
jgi:poly-gamma-glutamate synthesis protein (capsule biosynthesis protein)